MYDKLVKMVAVVAILASVACATKPPALHPTGLTVEQVKMLEDEGFKYTDEGWSLGISSRLLFDTGSAEVKEGLKVELAELARKLKQHQLNSIKVVGHTDNVGAEEYNQTLSEHRARSVAYTMLAAGYYRTNMQIVGRGMSQPLYDNDTEENRAENRRVEVIIVP